jgi:hypothetical protein
MSLPTKAPFPQSTVIAWLNSIGQQIFGNYLRSLDAVVSALAGGAAPAMVQAANDAAAARAGVPVNGFYLNGNVVQVRLK